MKNQKLKTTVQITAGLIALLGLLGTIIFTALLVIKIPKTENLLSLRYYILRIICLPYLVYLGYNVLKNYSFKSLKEFCLAFCILIFLIPAYAIQPLIRKLLEENKRMIAVICILGIFAIAIFLSKVLHKLIVKYTLDDNNPGAGIN